MRLLHTAKLAALFGLLTAILGAMGYLFLGGVNGMVAGLALAGVMNFASYWYSDRIVLKMHRAQPLDGNRHGELHETVARLSGQAGVPAPDLYLMQSDVPNAFATGRNPSNAVICVTSGLLQQLNRDEVEGVLAHEMAHVANRDTLIQAVAGTFAGAVSMLSQLLFFGAMGDDDVPPAALLGGMIAAPLLASMVKLAISRSREFMADATATQYTQADYLAAALQKIEAYAAQRPMRGGASGTGHMFIVNPFRGDMLTKLFSTHPPTGERVERLKQLA